MAYELAPFGNGELSGVFHIRVTSVYFILHCISAGYENQLVKYRKNLLPYEGYNYIIWILNFPGDVVQLVRTSDCRSEGRGFDPRRPRHFLLVIDSGKKCPPCLEVKFDVIYAWQILVLGGTKNFPSSL